jgi:hypothetical protein
LILTEGSTTQRSIINCIVAVIFFILKQCVWIKWQIILLYGTEVDAIEKCSNIIFTNNNIIVLRVSLSCACGVCLLLLYNCPIVSLTHVNNFFLREKTWTHRLPKSVAEKLPLGYIGDAHTHTQAQLQEKK